MESGRATTDILLHVRCVKMIGSRFTYIDVLTLGGYSTSLDELYWGFHTILLSSVINAIFLQ